MKTFRQFYVEAYQIDEVAITASPQNPLQRIQRGIQQGVSALNKSPLVSNPFTRSITRVAQNPLVKKASSVAGGALNIGFNRALGAEKLTTDDPKIGPIERGLGGISAMSIFAPGVSQTAGAAHNIIGSSPQLQKIDKRIGIEHGKALKSNPQGYLQMLGRSF